MDNLVMSCTTEPGDTLTVEFEDKVFITIDTHHGVYGDVALSVESATKLRDALTDWLEGQV